MSQALYRKWRSRTFADLVGQPHVVRTLQNALNTDRVAHAYLFNGPRGTGKTSTARLLAKALNCLNEEGPQPCGECPACQAIEEARYLDLIEIDAASNNGVEDIRELRNAVNFSPTEGGCKIYIVDEVHMLSSSAFNALLKTLEEPPSRVYFILATTEIHRIPATVISRCQRFDFRRITSGEIQKHLIMIAGEEGCQVEESAISVIAENSQGCMRDAISLLDQVVGLGGGDVTLKQVQELLGLTELKAINSFVRAIFGRDKVKGLAVLQEVMTQGGSIAEFLQQVITQLRAVFRFKLIGKEEGGEELPPEQALVLAELAEICSEASLLFALTSMVDAAAELKLSPHPQILVELALMAAIEGPLQLEAAATRTIARSPEEVPSGASERPDVLDQQRQEERLAKPERNLSQGSPTAQDREEKLVLRKNWIDLQLIVKDRWPDNKAQAALTREGMANLDVLGGTVFIYLRDPIYRNALKREERKFLKGKLSDYLRRDVKLELQLGEEVSSSQSPDVKSPSSATTAVTPNPLTEVDTYLRERLGARPLEEVEQQDLLDKLEETKGK